MSKKKYLNKKKIKRRVNVGVVYISASFNNLMITVADLAGNVLSWSSAGKAGFSGSRKSTPYAAQLVAEGIADYVQNEFSMKTVSVFVKGPGGGRESAIRTLRSRGLIVTFIKDITPLPHNGCRPKKRRRI